jgi:hypothetical protein
MGLSAKKPCRCRERSPQPLATDLLFDRLDQERASLARPHKPVDRFDKLLRDHDVGSDHLIGHSSHPVIKNDPAS